MIKLTNITKTFKNHLVIPGFTFEIEDERFYTIVGPNGCGKSTLLNIIARTIKQDSGEIISSQQEYKVGYVWQNYRSSMFPWLSITENIAFPLKVQGVSSKQRKKAVHNLIEEFEVEIDLGKKIYELSGGQQQLVNILRAVIIEPDLLLLDEPFSALDQYRSWQMGFKVEDIWMKRKCSVLFVSHDVDEAVLLADSIILLNKQGILENVLSNHMPRKRTKEMMAEQEHFRCRNVIVEFLFSQNNKRGQILP